MERNFTRHALLPALLCASVASAQTTFTVGNTTVTVTEAATGLNVPWDMVVGPDGWIWFTEIDGRVSRMDPDNGTIELLYTVPDVHETGLGGGLQSMAFHPDFANQPYVYLHYVNSASTTVVKRFYYDAAQHTFTSMSPHLLSVELHGYASHNGSRIVLDDEGMFLLSVGDCMGHSADVQDLSSTYGKIFRFDPEGGIPADNPIPGSYVYNWGHRNPQGLIKGSNGRMYNSAHGAGLDDEVNLVEPNRNYGWPSVAGLCNTPTEITYCEANNVAEPIFEWSIEVVAPSGIDFYANTAIPEWDNSILVATLRGKALYQLQLNAAGDSVVANAAFLFDVFGRFRDVLSYPDGRVFLSTSNHDWAGSPAANDDRIFELRNASVSTGVHTHATSTLRLSPNPANGLVRVLGAPAGVSTANLTDASGRLALRAAVDNGVLDASALAPGLYTVALLDGTRRTVARSTLLVAR
ncbi:MAG TPA: PQQ-dependent sugar dehydrogenase [Flavobacteriales bacterium]|jgi:glucose/arabinose dehydrogenase|nr:PQQ-dependent sugar dehydrogenase [Flavobacteriales bacterium]